MHKFLNVLNLWLKEKAISTIREQKDPIILETNMQKKEEVITLVEILINRMKRIIIIAASMSILMKKLVKILKL